MLLFSNGTLEAHLASYSVNVNDPGLITLVNKLQDVFATVGVSSTCPEYSLFEINSFDQVIIGPKSDRPSTDNRGRVAVKW